MSSFSKIICFVVSSLSFCACDPSDGVTWATGAIALASGLFSIKNYRDKNKFYKQESDLKSEALRCCVQSKPLVEAAAGTFLELSTYEAIPKKEKITRLAQEGHRLMDAITGQELQKPKPLQEHMALVYSIDNYVGKYIKRTQTTYQTERHYVVLGDIYNLQGNYEVFVQRQKARCRRLVGSSCVFMIAAGTACLSLESS